MTGWTRSPLAMASRCKILRSAGRRWPALDRDPLCEPRCDGLAGDVTGQRSVDRGDRPRFEGRFQLVAADIERARARQVRALSAVRSSQ